MNRRVSSNVRQSILAAFSRRTTSGQFIAEIDGLRFIAIALVVLFHLNVYLTAQSAPHDLTDPTSRALASLLGQGANGVQLFFIISGFVLALPFGVQYLEGGKNVNLRSYYLRRLTRLEPPYIVAMVGCSAALVLLNGVSASQLTPELLAHLIYQHNWLYPSSPGVNAVAWSLEIEVQFYILAPLIAALLFRIRAVIPRRVAIIVVVLVTITAQAELKRNGVHPVASLFDFIQFFLMGFILADVYIATWRRNPSQQLRWDVVWLLCWTTMYAVWLARASTLNEFMFPFVAAIMCIATFRSMLVRRCIANPWITTIGGMCYTIYLLHYQVISAVGRITRRIGAESSYSALLITQGVLIVLAILFMSAVFFVLIERPCMDRNWPHKLAERGRHARLLLRSQ